MGGWITLNKLPKIIVNSDIVKKAMWLKAASLYVPSFEYGLFMRFFTTLTQVGKNKFDDVPDAMAQLALFTQTFKPNIIKVMLRLF